MALYRSPLTVTLWPSSFLKKYGPMIPPAHKVHQTCIDVGGHHPFRQVCRASRPRKGILPKSHVRWLGESGQQPRFSPGAHSGQS
ncbi:hypothetical protein TNCV_3610191 [Trichonephila clavipes]|nr:hypothetical protein TNCV_3610191 [Trichonephila clavipes]